MRARAAALIASALTVAACGGGNTTAHVAPPVHGASGQVRFSLSMPRANVTSHGYRRPRDVSPATASVAITLVSVNGAAPGGAQAPTVLNVLPTSPQCAPGSSSGSGDLIVCSVTASGPVGTDVFAAAAFADFNGTGAQLSSGAVTANVTSGSTANAPLALDGIPAGIQLASTGALLPVGAKRNFSVFVIATDAAGEAIVGSEPYATPLTLNVNDPSGATTLAASSLNGPTVAVNGTYDGTNATASSTITIGASAAGVAPSAVVPAVLHTDNERGWVNGAHAVYAETVTTQFVPISGTPPPSTTTGSTVTDTISTNAMLDDQTGLVHVNEVVRPSAAPTAAPTTSDYYYAYAPGTGSASVNVQLVGERIVTPLGSTQSIDETQADVVDELPETAGTSWTNQNAYTSTYAAASGDGSPSQTYSANQGTYAFQNTYANGDHAYATANADGSGTYTYQFADNVTHQFNLAPPDPSGVAIAESIIQPGGSTTTQNATVPNWFPNATFPQPPFSDAYTDAGTVAVPPACNVPPSIATSANEIDETFTITDPLVGIILTQSRKAYIAANIGRVCTLENDSQQEYYVIGSAAIEGDGIPQIFIGSLLGTFVTTTSVGMQSTSAVPSVRARRP